MTSRTWYPFAPGEAAGGRDLLDLLGGKGANLAEMSALGVPVPPGFTLPTTLVPRAAARTAATPPRRYSNRSKRAWLTSSSRRARAGGGTGVRSRPRAPARFGDRERPLLVSVRSGARASMPGMMDTVLNLGLNRDAVEALAAWSGDRRFALDSYRRLIQMYGGVVKGLDREALETPLQRRKSARGVRFDHELDEEDLEAVIADLERVYAAATGEAFPTDPREQLRQSVAAVFRSWNGKRARAYRGLHGIPE